MCFAGSKASEGLVNTPLMWVEALYQPVLTEKPSQPLLEPPHGSSEKVTNVWNSLT
jgi:hypothetical protein